MTWTEFTRRTELPKLAWIMCALNKAGIKHRINGRSFNAPILEVKKKHFDAAWKLLGPIDNLADDDSMFDNVADANGWWLTLKNPRKVGALVGSVGLIANKLRCEIASSSNCIPKEASDYDCPLATGVIDVCPQNLLVICKPMSRVELFGIALMTSLGAGNEETIAQRNRLICELNAQRGQASIANYMISFCHVLAQWLTDNGFAIMAGLAEGEAETVVEQVMRETMTVHGKIVPRRVTIVLSELLDGQVDHKLN